MKFIINVQTGKGNKSTTKEINKSVDTSRFLRAQTPCLSSRISTRDIECAQEPKRTKSSWHNRRN